MTTTFCERPRLRRALYTDCIAGRRYWNNWVSLVPRTSLPTLMQAILVVERYGWTFCWIQDLALEGSVMFWRFSFPSPITNSTLEFAKATRTFGSASYSLILLTLRDCIRTATRDGDGRLFAIWP